MSIESDLHAAVATVCTRVFPAVAPIRTARPYVTVQNIGGFPTYYMDSTPATKRVRRYFVKTYANSKAEALTLAQQIEVAVMASTAFTARVESELLDNIETDVEPWLYSELQEFMIIGDR